MTTTVPVMIQRLNSLPRAMQVEIRSAMERSLLTVESDARRYAPRDQGRLGGSISYTIKAEELHVTGEVGPSVRYGAPVEFGRNVGTRMPPIAALIPWVERHWRPARVGRQLVLGGLESEAGQLATNRRRAVRPVTPGQVRRRAFLLARAIQRRGIRRRPYMAEAYNKNRTQILMNFSRIGVAVAASVTGGTVGSRAL